MSGRGRRCAGRRRNVRPAEFTVRGPQQAIAGVGRDQWSPGQKVEPSAFWNGKASSGTTTSHALARRFSRRIDDLPHTNIFCHAVRATSAIVPHALRGEWLERCEMGRCAARCQLALGHALVACHEFGNDRGFPHHAAS